MISINGDDLTKVRCFDLATDLLLDNAMDKAPMRRRGEIEWQPLFWPKQFVQQGHDHTLEGNKLSEAKLRTLGKKITKMRTNLRETAAALPVIPEDENEGLDQMQRQIQKLGVKIHKGYFKPKENKTKLVDF